MVLLERSGRVCWRRRLTQPPAPAPNPLRREWEWRGAEADEDGGAVRVVASWTRHANTEPDGYLVFDHMSTTTTLDLASGEIIGEQDGIHPPARDPRQFPPAIGRTFGTRPGVHVREEALRLDEQFGGVTLLELTPDERRILVATDAAWVLRIDQARRSLKR